MKKVRVLCFVLVLIISTSCFSFAAVPEVLPEKGNEIELQYVATSRVTPLLSISGGVADYSVTVIPKSSTSIGYIGNRCTSEKKGEKYEKIFEFIIGNCFNVYNYSSNVCK